jgi:exopolyphosphatase/guanosine-5'-triphosphate,3'-diphosphate pyrophosphatase
MAEYLALVDVGSHAVRLLLAQALPGVGFCILREGRVRTRLGGGDSPALAPAAVAETIRAVRRFLREVRGYKPRPVAVATAAVREATNRALLLDGLGEAGIEVEVLSGEEEARLGALTVLRSMSCPRAVIVDLGGGSLQMTQVRGGEIVAAASFPLGAVRLTRRFLKHDPPAAHELAALREEVRAQVQSFLPRAQGDAVLVGLGGTARALARMHGAARARHDLLPPTISLPRSDVTRFRGQLAAVPARARHLPGLRADRADIIVAGVVVIEELMILGGYQTLTICFHGGVRHGVLARETFRTGG